MSRLRCFLTPRAWILSSRAENESLGGGLSRTFFAAMRLGEDLGQSVPLDALLPVWQHAARMSGTRNQFFLTRAASVRYGVVFETACACAGDAGRRQTGYAYCYLERRTWESKGVTEQ